MTKYLFRGKQKNNGEWVEGFVIFADGKAFILNDVKVEFINGYNENRLNFVLQEVIPETVGMWTGLTDKNGTKIFGGDKIKSTLAWYTVASGNGDYGLRPFDKGNKLIPLMGHNNFDSSRVEVVGNIHDNSDLLEVK